MQNKKRVKSICDNLFRKVMSLLGKKIREYWFCLFKKFPKVLLKSREKIFVKIYYEKKP